MKKTILLTTLLLLLPSISVADEIIKGRYCYTYGDNESLKEARELTRTLAVRDAIESYRVFIESTSTVKNFMLTNDLLQMISSGYLKNVEVLEHTEKGRTICETIQASISPKAVENLVKRAVRKRTKRVEELGLDNNGCLKILKVEPSEQGIKVIVEALREVTSWNECFKVCVDFLDADEDRIGEDSIHLLFLLAGQTRTIYFSLPSDARSYRVWLAK
ncbi:MAG: hypothetical protein KAT27_00115 [Desulfobacterales bacterium]|nr:hypothetical protein [Desulfobacterales bacterium]